MKVSFQEWIDVPHISFKSIINIKYNLIDTSEWTTIKQLLDSTDHFSSIPKIVQTGPLNYIYEEELPKILELS